MCVCVCVRASVKGWRGCECSGVCLPLPFIARLRYHPLSSPPPPSAPSSLSPSLRPAAARRLGRRPHRPPPLLHLLLPLPLSLPLCAPQLLVDSAEDLASHLLSSTSSPGHQRDGGGAEADASGFEHLIQNGLSAALVELPPPLAEGNWELGAKACFLNHDAQVGVTLALLRVKSPSTEKTPHQVAAACICFTRSLFEADHC